MERTHIVFFGPTNSGKSTLVNAIAGQQVSLVSEIPGTTTDPVRKLIELPYGIGPAVLVDTAGLDDASVLGPERRRLALAVLDDADIAVIVRGEAAPEAPVSEAFAEMIAAAGIPVITYTRGESVDVLLQRIAAALPPQETHFLTDDLVKPGDTVLLVMPQDSEGPPHPAAGAGHPRTARPVLHAALLHTAVTVRRPGHAQGTARTDHHRRVCFPGR